MIVAATSSSNFRPEFRSSAALPSSPDFADHATKAVISCILSAKSALNVFNKIQPIFSAFVGPQSFVLNTFQPLFCKTGG
jgi:hypothetical protein